MRSRQRHAKAQAVRLTKRARRTEEYRRLIPEEARRAELVAVAVVASSDWLATGCSDTPWELMKAVRELVSLGMPLPDLAGLLDISQSQLRILMRNATDQTDGQCAGHLPG